MLLVWSVNSDINHLNSASIGAMTNMISEIGFNDTDVVFPPEAAPYKKVKHLNSLWFFETTDLLADSYIYTSILPFSQKLYALFVLTNVLKKLWKVFFLFHLKGSVLLEISKFWQIFIFSSFPLSFPVSYYRRTWLKKNFDAHNVMWRVPTVTQKHILLEISRSN